MTKKRQIPILIEQLKGLENEIKETKDYADDMAKFVAMVIRANKGTKNPELKMAIGQLLAFVRDHYRGNNWNGFLRRCQMSERTARNYVKYFNDNW